MKADVQTLAAKKSGTVDLSDHIFGLEPREDILQRMVRYQLAKRQAGTHKTKSRGEVRGPNKKRWKQKHTGNARMGTKKSGIWRGGGAIFGPRPRDFSYHMPVKARRTALRNAVYTKFRDNEVAIADGQGEAASRRGPLG